MNKKLLPSLLAMGTLAAAQSTVVAAPAPDLCVSSGYGVPSRYGPPRWSNSAFTPGAAYGKNAEVYSDTPNGRLLYRVEGAGGTAGATAPTGFGTAISDGVLKWDYVTTVDDDINDPRWLLATGHNFNYSETGAAQVPLKTRALYFDETTGQRYMYLSFIVNVTPLPGGGGSGANPRDLYVAIKPPLATQSPTGVDETSYMLQFHLDGNPVSGAPNVKPTFCNADTLCATAGNYWRLYVQQSAATSTCYDPGYPGKCAIGLNSCASDADCTTPGDECDASGAKFIAPPSPTMAFADGVRMWKLGTAPAGQSQLDNNQWAVEIRIPMVDTSQPNYGKCTKNGSATTVCTTDADCAAISGSTCKTSLRDGIPWSSASGAALPQVFYELTANIGPSGAIRARAMISSWPRKAGHVCADSTANTLVVPGLDDGTQWSKINMFDAFGDAPAGCEGIKIEQGDIGTIKDPTGTTDSYFVSTPLETEIHGNAVNEMVARISNSKNTAVTAAFIARFRLADWGTVPFSGGWGTTDIGSFNAMRGAINGICGTGTPVLACKFGGNACTVATQATDCPSTTALPGNACLQSIPGPTCADTTVPAKVGTTEGKTAIHFPFVIGGGTADKSEYCKYGLTTNLPGGATCQPCGTGGTGLQAVDPAASGGTAYSCIPAAQLKVDHQCLMVEIDAPNNDVDFVNRSHWNNLEFRPTSTLTQTAVIDTSGLPKSKYQLYNDVVLVVEPRNMPQTSTPTTSVDLIRSHVDQDIQILSKPYLQDIANGWSPNNEGFAARQNRKPLWVPRDKNSKSFVGCGSGQEFCQDQRDPNQIELDLIAAGPAMSDDDYVKAGKYLDIALTPDGPGQAELLTHKAVDLLGPAEAATMLPTLDVYSYYRIDPLTSNPKLVGRYAPMSSFSVFLYHDQAEGDGFVNGFDWEIDGFQKVGKNVYHEILPVDVARKIQIRAESKETGDKNLPPGNPEWGEGCSAGGGGALGVIPAGLAIGFVLLRRRRKQK